MKKDFLFELIHSLEKNEKRYFKLFASRNSKINESSYVKLFNVVEKQKIYDEKQLIQHFSGTSIGKNFKVTKHYLYKLILKSLHAFHTNSSVDAQLKERLHYIEILFEKCLYEQCEENIAQAEKLAEKYEKYLMLLDLLHWKIRIIQIQRYSNKSEEDMKHIFDKVSDIISNYLEINAYRFLHIKLMLQHRKYGSIRQKTDIQMYKDIIHHPLFKQISASSSFHAQFLFYQLKYIYYYIVQNDVQKTHIYVQKLAELMKTYHHHIADDIYKYRTIVINTALFLMQQEKYQEALLELEKFRNIKTKTKNDQFSISVLADILEMKIYISLCQFEQGVLLAEKLKEKISNKAIINNKYDKIVLYYNCATVYFGTGDYLNANKWLNMLLNDTSLDVRNDILCFAQILQIVIHYEKYRNELIGYKVISVERFMKKKSIFYQYEKVILDFFKKKVPKIDTEIKAKNALNALKNELLKITKNPLEKKALDYFDFISWIDSKIEGKTFAEVVRGKIRN